MRPNHDIEALFPPLGRHAYLDAGAVKALVKRLGAEEKIPAVIERRGSSWRLRVRIARPDGTRLRRGVTLPDEETAAWVRDYLAKAAAKGKRTGVQGGDKHG